MYMKQSQKLYFCMVSLYYNCQLKKGFLSKIKLCTPKNEKMCIVYFLSKFNNYQQSGSICLVFWVKDIPILLNIDEVKCKYHISFAVTPKHFHPKRCDQLWN